MSIYRPNPSQVTLQATAHNIDGTPKTALTSAKVRVYHMDGVTEVQDLALTDMTQVGATNTWRYVWTSPTMPVGVYFAEYALVDTDGASFVDVDTMVVMDVALEETLVDVESGVATAVADISFIKKIEKNRKRIFNNQLIIYADDGVTEWLKWDLFDANGIPTNGVKVYDTVPV
jgi:hypothetical protein